MAAPTYGTDLALIDDAEDVGLYSALGGGAAGLADEGDYFVEGTQCISKGGFTAATKGFIHDEVTLTIAAGDAIFSWLTYWFPNLMDIQANGGQQVVVGSSASDYDHFYVRGSDSNPLGGWMSHAVDPTQTPSTTTGTPTDTTFVGALWKILGSGSLKGNPSGSDVTRHGRELTCINGETADFATFAGAAAFDAGVTRRWGLISAILGGLYQHGAFVMGTVATAVDFRDSDRAIFILDDPFVPSGFNEFEIRNSGSNVEWTGITITALGTVSRGILTLNVGTVALDGCTFNDIDTSVFLSTGSALSCKWNRTNAITAPGTTLTGSKILLPTVAANTSALIWDVATDPDGKIDGMEFSEGTNLHHAIEFGTTSPLTMTLRGIDFTGFSATQDVNNSTFHIKRTSDTVTINLVGCTGVFGYRTDGATVVLVVDPVTLNVNCEDSAKAAVENVRVLVWTTATGGYPGDGSYPGLVTLTSLTQLSGTATATFAAAHNMTTGEELMITEVVNEQDYNGTHVVTVTGGTTLTFPVPSGIASPATGTIIASAVLINNDLTNASGLAQDSRTYPVDQPFDGFARKKTSSPVYKTSPVSGTVSAASGRDVIVPMTLD